MLAGQELRDGRSEAIAVRVSAAADPRVSIEGDALFNNPDDSDRSQ